MSMPDNKSATSLKMTKVTANLYTEDVGACIRFWVDQLGFEKTIEVPDGSDIAFAALRKGDLELMYGSYASLEKESAIAGSYVRGTSFLFIEVEDVESVFAAVSSRPIVVPMHKTFYGATEFTVRDPANHLVTFAQFASA